MPFLKCLKAKLQLNCKLRSYVVLRKYVTSRRVTSRSHSHSDRCCFFFFAAFLSLQSQVVGL